MADTPKRVVPVTITGTAQADGSMKFSATPEPANIIKGSSNVLIVFTLAADGYRFAKSKAIELKTAQADFPYKSWTISETLAALYDSNKNVDQVAYTVNMLDPNGNPVAYDPEIRNGGGGGGDGACDGDDDGDDDDCDDDGDEPSTPQSA
jgi:hypothetical protein